MASPWETMVTLILARLDCFVGMVGLGVCLLFKWSRWSFCSKPSTCSPDTGTAATHKEQGTEFAKSDTLN